MSIEKHFDVSFTAALAKREKQIQQNYRPIIGIHKWFARRPGTVFRNLLLAEFNGGEPIDASYWRAHKMHGVIADPFMGGGTTIFEANRLGFNVIGTDINPMAYWIVRQSLASLNLTAFSETAEMVAADVEREVGELYTTACIKCSQAATVKYFLWVKVQACPTCGTDNDLFPGYLLAEATRHPRHVVSCSRCGALNEYDELPKGGKSALCGECGASVQVEGPARRQRLCCRKCETTCTYPGKNPAGPPRHRMWAIEYHCASCKTTRAGRFFKQPDAEDLAKYQRSADILALTPDLPIPEEEIPAGDETARLHRWGYRRFREMFNARQQLGLGLLLRRIRDVSDASVRHALLTVFSDCLRYQNMLCRYDTYALKCQDIFSVHGFPVGLIQCENNLLGIPGVGAGAFRHFVEKYRRAKLYCQAPFETRYVGRRKEAIPVPGERIAAEFVDTFPIAGHGQACIMAAAANEMPLPPESLDGVFTDPPYYDNVQYAELMDFCFAWLRLGLGEEFEAFRRTTTRTRAELTGNATLRRGLDDFTAGLSEVFRHYAKALKPGAPFAFTYHHNDPIAYVPAIVAILDAELDCTATLPVPAEMGASLHISGTKSSILDTVFVCRAGRSQIASIKIEELLCQDIAALAAANIRVSEGDVRCLVAGHVARAAINRLRVGWDASEPLPKRMNRARELSEQLAAELRSHSSIWRQKTGTTTNEPLAEQHAQTI